MTALVATIPAGLLLPRTEAMVIGGTIWNGQAVLRGGSHLDWSWAPLRSLSQLGFATDWQATGPATDLTGHALLKFGRVILDNVQGEADGSLLGVIAPGLPFSCEMAMSIDLPRLVLGGNRQGFEGEVRSDPGVCRTRERNGLATSVPALRMTADRLTDGSTLATIAPRTGQPTRFVKITLGQEGRLAVGVTPEGARALPFLSPSSGMSVELDL